MVKSIAGQIYMFCMYVSIGTLIVPVLIVRVPHLITLSSPLLASLIACRH